MARTNLSVSISADGYVAGPNQSEDHPLGVGGRALHEWHLGPTKDHPANLQVISDMMDGIGATIMGRNMFGPIRGEWGRGSSRRRWVFALNAVSFLAIAAVVASWRAPERADVGPRERLVEALWAGGRYVRHALIVRRLLYGAILFIPAAIRSPRTTRSRSPSHAPRRPLPQADWSPALGTVPRRRRTH